MGGLGGGFRAAAIPHNRYMWYDCFITYQNLYLADRTDLFRISTLVVTQRYNILDGTAETVEVRYSKLASSPSVSVKINGFGDSLGHSKFYTLTDFGRLKSSEGAYRVSQAYTLRKTGRTRVGVHTSSGTGNIVKSLVANDKKVFKTLTFRTY